MVKVSLIKEKNMGNLETENIQYISNPEGETVAVVVPIQLWREIASELETKYLTNNKIMLERILEARKRTTGISLKKVCETFGI